MRINVKDFDKIATEIKAAYAESPELGQEKDNMYTGPDTGITVDEDNDYKVEVADGWEVDEDGYVVRAR